MGLPKRNCSFRYPTLVKRVLPLLLFLAFFSCGETETKTEDPQAHRAEVEKWQSRRDASLRADDGWLSLVALEWLNEGANTLPDLGVFTLQNGKVTLRPDSKARLTIDGQPVTASIALKDDTEGDGPTVVTSGSKRFQIIKRAGRYGVRVKDAQSEARMNFKGLDYYPIDSKWRVDAKLEPHNPEKKIPITNIVGQTTDEMSPGALVFTIDGQTYRLDPILEQGSTDYFVIFKDETSRDTTYPAGRYLYTSPAGPDGKVVLDFNKAYNPPCVFTPFATCPLPPQQNRLPLRIEAGEKNYKPSHT
jgi:uncharacterized protein (DUF1684 family)